MHKLSDDDFIAAFKKSGGIDAMSRELRMDRRSLQRRRRSLEIRRNVVLQPETLEREAQVGYGVKPWTALEVTDGNVIVFSDAHFYAGAPTSTANRALLRLCRKLKPVAVIANGDILDAPQISRHPPIGWQRQPVLSEEVAEARARLAEIAAAAPGSRLLRTVGNHDLRFDQRLAQVAGEFRDIAGMRLRDHLPGWDESWAVRINGDCVVKHRWHGGLSATWSNTLKSGVTMVTGHLHRLTVSPHADYNGRRWGVDSGTLADTRGAHAEYLEENPTGWSSGFAVLTFCDGKLITPELCEVLYGRAWFRGAEVK